VAPSKKPAAATPPGASAHTADCELQRRRAKEARQVHDWTGALRNTADAACWSSITERKRLRVQALMEQGRFADCTREAGASPDRQIVRWTTICRKRLEG
jgi:hypothetical protein